MRSSISPVSSFGLVVPSGRRAILPTTRITSSDRSRPACSDHLRTALWAGHDLGLAVAVAKVDEHRAAVIAGAVHPSAERYFLSNMFRPKLAASVSSQQGSQSYGLRSERSARTPRAYSRHRWPRREDWQCEAGKSGHHASPGLAVVTADRDVVDPRGTCFFANSTPPAQTGQKSSVRRWSAGRWSRSASPSRRCVSVRLR